MAEKSHAPAPMLKANQYLPPASLRDEFAMRAIAGMLANPGTPLNTMDGALYARAAYVIADEMLEAREAENDRNHG